MAGRGQHAQSQPAQGRSPANQWPRPESPGCPTRISADPMCSTAEQARHHESLSCGSPLPALIATGSHPLKTKASQTTQNELKDSFIQSVDMTSYDLSMGFLLDYLHIYMIFLLVSYDISLRFLWVLKGFLWHFYDGISMRFLWNFYGGSIMGFLLDSCAISWYVYDISLGLLLDFYGMSMVFLWDSYRVSKGCLCDFHWILMGFP
jgi:hypothetical protein